jgi:ABC-type multidrug transport system ATPase subunit
MPPILTATSLGKKFEDRWVLRNLNIELHKGQSLIVLGANGSGKSTLLRLLAGLLAPSAGTIDRPKPENTAIGYFALDMRVYASLTVREHLVLAGELRDIPPEADKWIEKIGLQQAADRYAGQLSTGMRSRLKLALAAQPSPKVLLLDEPSAGLDEEGRELVLTLVREQLTNGAVVLATNDSQEIAMGTHELRIG